MSDYEIVTLNGRELRKYPDGSFRDERGVVVASSSERGRMMREGRKLKGMVQAGKAIQEASDSETVDEGVRKILKKRAEVALTDNGRAGNDAAKLVLQAAQYIVNERKVEVGGKVVHTARPVIDEETMELIMRLAEARRQAYTGAEVIDGKVTDTKE